MSFTPGPWHVRDFRASELERLGWVGPSMDRILIVNNVDPRDENGCVIARIQFDNRSEQLGEESLADARLIAAAPDLLAALKKAAAIITGENTSKSLLIDALEQTRAALSKAEGHIGQELAPDPERQVNGNANGDEG